MEKVKCAVCNSDNYEVFIESKDYRYKRHGVKFRLVKCNDCGLLYLNPRPSSKEIAKFYPEEYFDTKFGFLGKQINSLFSKLDKSNLKKYKKKGKILDLGCGAGNFLFEMKKQNFETFGVDISTRACNIAEKKGIKVFNKDLKSCHFPDNFFDIVTLWHVFEHLHNPDFTLKEIYRILKIDGLLVIEVPNAKSLSFDLFKRYCFHLDLPRHLYQWSPETLEKIVNKNNFKVLKTKSFSIGFPLSFFHSFYNFLFDKKITSPIIVVLIFIFSPLLISLTLFSRIFPTKGEILRVYAFKNKNLRIRIGRV